MTKLPWWLALALSVTAGVLLRCAFPGVGLWWLAPVGIALWCWTLLGRAFWAGSLVSLAGSYAFWLTLVHWTSLYLGAIPWVALATVMSLSMALGGGLVAWLMLWIPRLWPGPVSRFVLTPTAVASAWVAREWVASTWPYGGFSWGRIAMSQTEGWFAESLSWFGATGLSWFIVALSALLVQLLRPGTGLRARAARWATAGLVAVTTVLALLPVWAVGSAGTVRVLAVQGGADASLFTSLPAGEVFNAHIAETERHTGERVDVVLWPENAADIDPTRSSAAAEALTRLADRMAAPLVVGAVTERDGAFFNSSLLWQPGVGLSNWIDKAHPVPFAEYMPDRAFWRPFAPDLIDMVGRDYQAGTGPNVLTVAGTRAGVAICFDIAYDELLRQMLDGGAELIFAQSNNADFGRTDESLQQLEIARMRAIESGRAVVNISTVGVSAVIDGSGRTIDDVPAWTPASLTVDVNRASGQTLATMLSPTLVPLAVGFAPALVGLVLLHRASRRYQTRRAANATRPAAR